MADDEVYGTAERDAPVTRADFERALRHQNLSDLDLRDHLLKLAAHVVALTDEVTRRLDGVEPIPAPPGTPAAPPTGTVEAAVAAAMPDTLANIRAGDTRQVMRVSLDTGGDKYAAVPATPPCDELLPLCKARCCKLTFALSTKDLDEGVVRWDYAQPYLIRQRASDGYCVHCHPDTLGCTVHAYRPRVCRSYDCRNDERIWKDYAQRIPAPFEPGTQEGAGRAPGTDDRFDLMERARRRGQAILEEELAISRSISDPEPRVGPPPPRRR